VVSVILLVVVALFIILLVVVALSIILLVVVTLFTIILIFTLSAAGCLDVCSAGSQ
jgi:hypothetical protein